MEKCELLNTCGFFQNFNSNTEVINQGWIKMFCDQHSKSERCERKIIRKETGKPPIDSMSPTGRILS